MNIHENDKNTMKEKENQSEFKKPIRLICFSHYTTPNKRSIGIVRTHGPQCREHIWIKLTLNIQRGDEKISLEIYDNVSIYLNFPDQIYVDGAFLF